MRFVNILCFGFKLPYLLTEFLGRDKTARNFQETFLSCRAWVYLTALENLLQRDCVMLRKTFSEAKQSHVSPREE